jgi:Ni/Fe-hydrogenase subunit HybB-like protein
MSLVGWIYLTGTFSLLMFWLGATVLNRSTARLNRTASIGLLVFWAVSLGVLGLRFIKGLGAITNMTDSFPWGVWIGLLQGGVALAAGGYVTAATVHIFNIRRFEPLVKPMVLTAFLGYLFVALTLFVEVGQPQRLWHPLVMWQDHSIMFEVAWCVTLYMTVLLIEFSPVVFEKLEMPKIVHYLHLAAIPIVIAGVILSTLHQSSMGSMFLILPQKMNSLWKSPLLPVFFLISSVGVGLSMAIVESFISHRLFRRSLQQPLLEELARAAGVVLTLYFLIKIIDILVRGAWPSIAEAPWLGFSFLLEVGAGVLVPAVLFLSPSFRQRPMNLFLASLLVGAGILLNRINVSWFALASHSHSGYWPSWMELTVSFFFVTVTAVLFGLAMRFLPVFPKENPSTID